MEMSPELEEAALELAISRAERSGELGTVVYNAVFDHPEWYLWCCELIH